MNPLIVLGEDNIVYRLDPSAIYNADDVIQKIANQKFASVDNYATFDVAVGCQRGEVKYGQHNFNFSLSYNGDCIYWSHIPGLIFDTKFSLVEHGTQTRIITDLGGTSPDSVSDKMYWDVNIQNQLAGGNISMKMLFAVVIGNRNCSNPKRVGVNLRGGNMKCHLLFQVVDTKENKNLGNFLPCLPNIYNDGSICMGHDFDCTVLEGQIDKNIQRAITWFFESKMNRDLLESEVSRGSIAASIFGWDCNKAQLKSLVPINEKTFVKKVGNYYIDGLPTI
jgi:hypothetical protein